MNCALRLEPARLIAGATILVLAIAWGNYVVTRDWPTLLGTDNRAYWEAWAGGGLYEPGARLAKATYIYSPAFAMALWPLTLLPFDVFHVAWMAGSVAIVAWLVWPLGGVLRVMALLLCGWWALEARADVLVGLSVAPGNASPRGMGAPFADQGHARRRNPMVLRAVGNA